MSNWQGFGKYLEHNHHKKRVLKCICMWIAHTATIIWGIGEKAGVSETSCGRRGGRSYSVRVREELSDDLSFLCLVRSVRSWRKPWSWWPTIPRMSWGEMLLDLERWRRMSEVTIDRDCLVSVKRSLFCLLKWWERLAGQSVRCLSHLWWKKNTQLSFRSCAESRATMAEANKDPSASNCIRAGACCWLP